MTRNSDISDISSEALDSFDSDDYDTKRRPAWTDRILYRVNTYNLEDVGKKQGFWAALKNLGHSKTK